MAAVRYGSLELFPENILIDILSYLNVRELVRNSRVCSRWKQLVKDQRLWRAVDLTTWKGLTSRVLWILLRQYLGRGLRYLRLRGLLVSARGGSFLTESWLQSLSSKCPRLRRLYLLHTDLCGLRSCSLLPPSVQVLELHFCEVPPDFFTHNPSVSEPSKNKTEIKAAPSGITIQTLVVNTVPSFSDQHLRSLGSWTHLSRLELRDLIRVTVAGLKGCVPPGTQALAHLKHLELETRNRTQMVALGLGEGWPGLEGLSLGGKEVSPGLLSISRLPDLRWLRLRMCRLTQVMVLRSCRSLTQLRTLEFSEVEFIEEMSEEETDSGTDRLSSEDDPVPKLRRAICALLPRCSICFTKCTLTVNKD